MQKYYNSVQDTSGKAISGASITVTLTGGGTPIIYSDNGITPVANPLLTDVYGRFFFYAADGRYTLAVTSGSINYTLTDIVLLDGSSFPKYALDAKGNTLGIVGAGGGVTRQLSPFASQRTARTAAWNAGPIIVAPLRVDSTAYLAGDAARLADGTHLTCTVGGIAGVGAPTGYYDGRPITDGAVTWYLSGFKKLASDVDAPTVTYSATAAAAGLTETKFVNGSTAPTFLTSADVIPFNRSNGAFLGTVAFASGNSSFSANATGDVTSGSGFPLTFSGEAYASAQFDCDFFVNDSKFMLVFQNSSARIQVLIDGKPAFGSLQALQATGGSGYVFDYNGVQKNRRITIAGLSSTFTIRGVAMTAQGSLGTVPRTSDVMLMLGDSFCNTVTPAVAEGHLGSFMKRNLGFGGVVNAGVGGSGYIAANANTYNLLAVLASASNKTIFPYYAPTHIFVNAGGNDRGVNSVAAIQAAALATWQAIRAMFPSAKISITDGYSANGGPDANAIAVAAGLATTFTTWADSNSRFVTSVGAGSSASFIWGTGNVGAAVVAGNASIFTSTDTVHPSPGGSRYLAARFSDAINTAWNVDY